MVLEFDCAFAPGETGEALIEKSCDVFTLANEDLNLVFTMRKRGGL